MTLRTYLVLFPLFRGAATQNCEYTGCQAGERVVASEAVYNPVPNDQCLHNYNKNLSVPLYQKNAGQYWKVPWPSGRPAAFVGESAA